MLNVPPPNRNFGAFILGPPSFFSHRTLMCTCTLQCTVHMNKHNVIIINYSIITRLYGIHNLCNTTMLVESFRDLLRLHAPSTLMHAKPTDRKCWPRQAFSSRKILKHNRRVQSRSRRIRKRSELSLLQKQTAYYSVFA